MQTLMQQARALCCVLYSCSGMYLLDNIHIIVVHSIKLYANYFSNG